MPNCPMPILIFVSANYDFKNTVLDTHIKAIQTIQKDGIKIGVFGLGN